MIKYIVEIYIYIERKTSRKKGGLEISLYVGQVQNLGDKITVHLRFFKKQKTNSLSKVKMLSANSNWPWLNVNI